MRRRDTHAGRQTSLSGPVPVFRSRVFICVDSGRCCDLALKASSLFGYNPALLCALAAEARLKQAGLGAKS